MTLQELLDYFNESKTIGENKEAVDMMRHYSREAQKITMKIRLLKRYAPEQFTFEVLKSEYGIYAIRGPRGVPNSLSSALKG